MTTSMQSAYDALVEELRALDDRRALVVEGLDVMGRLRASGTAASVPGTTAVPAPTRRRRPAIAPIKAAVLRALRGHDHPLTVDELLEVLERDGIDFGTVRPPRRTLGDLLWRMQKEGPLIRPEEGTYALKSETASS